MYRPDLLMADIDEMGITKKHISKKTGIPYKTLCKKIDGDILWKIVEAEAVGNVLGYSEERWKAVFMPKTEK